MAEIYGVIHLPDLRYYSSTSLGECVKLAREDAALLEELGYDGVILENFHDQPFRKTRVGYEVLAKLSIIAWETRSKVDFQVGINVLRNACSQAMTIGSVTSLDFIRCNVWEGTYVTDQGVIEGASQEVMDLKKKYKSVVAVFADIFVKHASPLGDFSILEAAEHALGRGGAERVIVSGSTTGGQTPVAPIMSLNEGEIYPMVGSGLTVENMEQYAGRIQGGIVGTAIKREGRIDNDLAEQFVRAWKDIF